MLRNASESVIGISSKNPHYFQYKGKEILLITSAEHYGAAVNKRFDYVKYFDTLAKYGLNYTRIYPGAFIESPGSWAYDDPLVPAADVIVPWARSGVPGYIGGGNKFDLEKWDPEYFTRLSDFLTEAGKRDIIVEICFFNCQYVEQWPYSPLYRDCNIQGVGDCDFLTCQTLNNKPLVREHLKYIEKIIFETNEFDNVIYEFVDEPTLFLNKSRETYEWICKLIDTAVATERNLPKKHMLAQQLELGIDFCDDDRVSIITTQYILMCSRQVGGVTALNNCYAYEKPIEINETFFLPQWYVPDDPIAISRLDAWEFMIGGGAAFNQLNGYFTLSNPTGENEINCNILTSLKNLREFLESFDYIKMYRDTTTVRKVSIGANINMISEKGKQYAMYLHHCFPNFGDFSHTRYEPFYGEYEPRITLRLDKGDYNVTFIEPASARVIGECEIKCDGEEIELACPCYTLDLAVKIISKE